MHSVAIRRDEGRGEDGSAEDALAELASTARRISALARTGAQPVLFAEGLIRLAEATVAAEELTRRQLAIRAVDEAGYARGFAAGAASRHLRAVRG